jgi:hypothetical protein
VEGAARTNDAAALAKVIDTFMPRATAADEELRAAHARWRHPRSRDALFLALIMTVAAIPGLFGRDHGHLVFIVPMILLLIRSAWVTEYSSRWRRYWTRRTRSRTVAALRASQSTTPRVRVAIEPEAAPTAEEVVTDVTGTRTNSRRAQTAPASAG